jgi:hypothetical protein
LNFSLTRSFASPIKGICLHVWVVAYGLCTSANYIFYSPYLLLLAYEFPNYIATLKNLINHKLIYWHHIYIWLSHSMIYPNFFCYFVTFAIDPPNFFSFFLFLFKRNPIYLFTLSFIYSLLNLIAFLFLNHNISNRLLVGFIYS